MNSIATTELSKPCIIGKERLRLVRAGAKLGPKLPSRAATLKFK